MLPQGNLQGTRPDIERSHCEVIANQAAHMEAKHFFRKEFCFQNSRDAGDCFSALKLEINKGHERRSKTSLQCRGKIISVKVSATDNIAMLASSSGIEGLAKVCRDMIEI